MKTDRFDTIGEVLEVETSIVEPEKIENSISKAPESDQVKNDYEYTRGNLYSLIEKGQEAINGIMELASESDSPRAYEVAGQLIKSVADTTDKLIDLQKKMKELDEQPRSSTTNVTNALFVGSTAELSKLLKAQKNKNEKI